MSILEHIPVCSLTRHKLAMLADLRLFIAVQWAATQVCY